jgi:hypothetical protein
MKTIKFDEFFDKYKPQLNHFTSSPDNDNFTFETFGEEIDYVRKQDNKHIWTVVDCENEESWIVPGFHIVNRSNYYITPIPWESEDIQVNDNEMCTTGAAKYACLEFIEDVLSIQLTDEQQDKLHDFWSNKF